GQMGTPTYDPDFAVVGLRGTDGADLWSVTIAGTRPGTDIAKAVAVDAAGNVVAGGFTTNMGTAEDCFVVKLRGSDGSELGRQTISGTANGDDFLAALVVDPAGDVLAAGTTVNTDSGPDFTVIKLRGSGGAVLWQQAIDGPGHGFDRAWALAVDAAGNAVATGYVASTAIPSDIAVVKFRGADGGVLWQRFLDGGAKTSDEGLAVALDATGDVVVAGFAVAFAAPPLFYTDFAVIKLNGADGSERWRRLISGDVSPTDYDNDIAYSVAVDGSGDVLA